jgi:hypothetical protein
MHLIETVGKIKDAISRVLLETMDHDNGVAVGLAVAEIIPGPCRIRMMVYASCSFQLTAR